MVALRGLMLAFGLFALSFALHIVGGASGQEWLFNLAVVLIFGTAVAFPAVALLFAGRPSGVMRNATLNLGFVIGTALTASAFWAANGRSFAWWEIPLAAAAVLGTSAVIIQLSVWLRVSPASAR